jgi:hypothetical protein
LEVEMEAMEEMGADMVLVAAEEDRQQEAEMVGTVGLECLEL